MGMSEYKRLTENKKHYYGDQQKIRQMCYMGFDGDCQYPTCCGCTFLNMYRRLAQYEDIGTPEEFAELAKAKAEGRLIELPCKVGDTVYWGGRFGSGISQGNVESLKISRFGFDLGIYDHGGMVIRRELEKVFLTREAAEVALKQIGGRE